MNAPATTYTPRTGSVADRAWQHLNAFGEMAARPLCDAIDYDDPTSLQASLNIALQHGYIAKRKQDGLNYYRCGDGTPPPAEHDDDPPVRRVVQASAAAEVGRKTPPKGANRDASTGQSHGAAGSDSPPGRGENVPPAIGAAPAFIHSRQDSQHVLKAEGESPDATDRETPPRRSPVGGPMGAGQAAAAAPSGDFRCALFSDGELRIEWRGQIIELEPAHTRQLVAYLDRLALEPTA